MCRVTAAPFRCHGGRRSSGPGIPAGCLPGEAAHDTGGRWRRTPRLRPPRPTSPVPQAVPSGGDRSRAAASAFPQAAPAGEPDDLDVVQERQRGEEEVLTALHRDRLRDGLGVLAIVLTPLHREVRGGTWTLSDH